MARRRKIEGKIFRPFIAFKKKSEAQKEARGLRSGGDFVRIIKRKKKFPFQIFTSKGRKRRVRI